MAREAEVGTGDPYEVEIFIDGAPMEDAPPLLADSHCSVWIEGSLEASLYQGALTNLSNTRSDDELAAIINQAFAQPEEGVVEGP